MKGEAMSNIDYHEAQALAMHGVGFTATTDDELSDAARAAGVMAVCLGCNTVWFAPEGISESARAVSARAYSARGVFECCDWADTVVY